ncbi:hypothetical protein HAL1_05018 [Halomonas sp. HAL1]|nr:hypothetical protein HAL1_05018 [Halomonas sp. HAL1]
MNQNWHCLYDAEDPDPRTSGDEPQGQQQAPQQNNRSPHERG